MAKVEFDYGRGRKRDGIPSVRRFFTISDEKYYYGMYEDIAYMIMPVDFTSEMDKDIAETCAIYFPENSENREMGKQYFASLIKANAPEYTNEDIEEIIQTAEEKQDDMNIVDGEKSLSFMTFLSEDYRYYTITRIYEQGLSKF